jgi:HEAT repeat protein
LVQLLNSEDHPLSAAAATALGQIGTPKAGRALREAAGTAAGPDTPLADALLSCAGLLNKDHPAEAKAIYTLLANAPQPHVKQAAERALKTL